MQPVVERFDGLQILFTPEPCPHFFRFDPAPARQRPDFFCSHRLQQNRADHPALAESLLSSGQLQSPPGNPTSPSNAETWLRVSLDHAFVASPVRLPAASSSADRVCSHRQIPVACGCPSTPSLRAILAIVASNTATGTVSPGGGFSDREKIIPALRGLADRFGFCESPQQIVGHEPRNDMHGDMIIVARIEQIMCQLRPESAFVAFKDHDAFPSARISKVGMASMCSLASEIWVFSTFPTIKAPILA